MFFGGGYPRGRMRRQARTGGHTHYRHHSPEAAQGSALGMLFQVHVIDVGWRRRKSTDSNAMGLHDVMHASVD